LNSPLAALGKPLVLMSATTCVLKEDQMKKIALAAAVAALLPTSAFAATDQGEATALVVAPITITHQVGAALDFGAFAASAGQVSVTAGGVGSTSGVVQLGTVAADGFDVAGDLNRSFSITTTGGSVGNGTDTMSFTTTSAASGTLDGTGNASFSVGGTLNVAGTESAGTYTGSYDATVEYN
jgi:Domain of unknown function (DUF4402)